MFTWLPSLLCYRYKVTWFQEKGLDLELGKTTLSSLSVVVVRPQNRPEACLAHPCNVVGSGIHCHGDRCLVRGLRICYLCIFLTRDFNPAAWRVCRRTSLGPLGGLWRVLRSLHLLPGKKGEDRGMCQPKERYLPWAELV